MSDLKLMALDSKDIEVISSCCQDAVLKVGELRYFAGEKRFVLTLNRFAWENDGEKIRHRSVLHFDRVNGVKLMGIDREDGETILSLLAVLFEETEAPGGTVELVFAGDGAIRLDVECIEAQLTDVGGSWAATSTPDHGQD